MRKGIHPLKFEQNATKLTHAMHRVIVPIYIPNEEGYFQDAFRVLKLCIESILLTTGTETRISLINNHCIEKVDTYIRSKMLEDDRIDRYVLNSENRGKIEGVVSQARGSFEELISVVDADMLFKAGWVDEVVKVFNAFPKAGCVSVVTVTWSKFTATSSTFFDLLTSFRLKKGKIIIDEEIRENCHSFEQNDPAFIQRELHKYQYYIRKNGATALVGCNHQAATYRREIFYHDLEVKTIYPFAVFYGDMPTYNSDRIFLDEPVDKMGMWRLSTHRSYAYHMGNTFQSSYEKKLTTLKNADSESTDLKRIYADRSLARLFPYRWRKYLPKVISRMERMMNSKAN
ncbi:MAG: glycosyltransferase family A protein [Saprospiraceae bacterium]